MDRLTRFSCPNCDSAQDFWQVRGLLPRLRFNFGRERYFWEKPEPLYDDPGWTSITCWDCLMELQVPRQRRVMVECFVWAFTIIVFGVLLSLAFWTGLMGLSAPGAGSGLDLGISVEDVLRDGGRGAGGSGMGLSLLIGIVAAPLSYFIARVVSYRLVILERAM